jgi:hypothetical protein
MPYEAWFGHRSDLRHMKVFGSCVCVRQSRKRGAKLVHHHFDGMFIGFTAMDQNIRYIDVNSGGVKRSHHAVFDEAWYLQTAHPSAAQLLHELGLQDEKDNAPILPPNTDTTALYPPCPSAHKPSFPPLPPVALHLHLPLRESDLPHSIAARAATTTVDNPFIRTSIQKHQDASVVSDYGIKAQQLEQVFFLPSPYNDAFEEHLDMKCFYPTTLPLGGMHFITSTDCLILQHCVPNFETGNQG